MANSAPLLGLVDIVEAVARGRLAPDAAVAEAWERAGARESELRAFAFLPPAPPPAGVGPLAGITVGVKDLIDTADMPTDYGSPAYVDHRPERDAWIVTRLRELGATILGKTVTTEFAFRTPGPTRNPHRLDHTPGGSSSGSAAAVGAGIVPLALGTQTLGSVIRPAAFCGAVGYKPTFGTFPRDGVHPLAGSLDHIGLMTRDLDDLIFVASLLVPDPDFAARLGLGSARRLGRDDGPPPRLGRLALPADGVEAEQRAVFESVIARVESAGHRVADVVLPEDFAEVPALADTILAYEAARIFGALVAREPDKTSAALRLLVERGSAIDEATYATAVRRQRELRDSFRQVAGDFDGLLTIPASGEAPRGLKSTGDPRFCLVWSFLGAPAVTFPAGKGAQGLPLGVQVVAAPGEDAALLRAARFCAPATA